MDRCALFVDAGYLLADGAMAVHGTRHREAVAWDYPGLLQLLSTLSRERTDLPILRCYWYEATVEGRRTPEHDALADLPGLKLRLARIRPGRREGVDAQVHRDLMTLARNNAICDAVVVSGDEDLAQVVSDAQDLGIRVTVIHITAEGGWAVSRTLQQECDDLIEIGSGHLRPYVNLVTGAMAAGADSGSAAPNGLYPSQQAGRGREAVQAAKVPPPAVPGSFPSVSGSTSSAVPGSLPAAGSAATASGAAGADPGPRGPGTGFPGSASAPEGGVLAPAGEAAHGAMPASEPGAHVAGAHEPGSVPEASPLGSSSLGATSVGSTSLGSTSHGSAPSADRNRSTGQIPHTAPPPSSSQASTGPGSPSIAHGPLATGGGALSSGTGSHGSHAVGPVGSAPAAGVHGAPSPGSGNHALPSRGTGAHVAGSPPPSPPNMPRPPQPALPAAYPSYTADPHQPVPAAQQSPPPAPPSPPMAAPVPPQPPAAPSQYNVGGSGGPPPYPGPHGPYTGPQPAPVPIHTGMPGTTTLADAVKAAHKEGHDFGESVARDAPALWLEAVLARKPRMPSDLEARLLQGSSLPIDFLLHDEVRHALRRGFWDALERARR